MGRGGPWKHTGGRSLLVERGVEKWALQVLGMACEVRDSSEVEGEVGHGQGVSLARGLPAERQGARQGGLGSGRGSGFPRERAPWRRGRGRGPGAGGWAGRARRASAPSPAEHPCRDGLVQGRPVCAGQQEGWVARVPGGRQAGAARPRTHGGEGSRARGTPLAGKAGDRKSVV